jgi:Tol biopolymer transport system component
MTALQPRWSPDGKQILFTQGSDLMVCDAAGRGVRKIVSVPGTVDRPAWSPDGKVLSFYVRDEQLESGSLWEVSADGGNLHPVFPDFSPTHSSGRCCGRWTPDGGYFLFEAWQGDKTNLWVRREKRGIFDWKKPSPVQLTSGPGYFTDPIPSRDGKKIFIYQINPESLVWRYDPPRHAMNPIPGTTHRTPYSDPLGEWVISTDLTEGTIWRSRTDGSEPMQLTHTPLYADSAQWSPDGAQVLLSARDFSGQSQIYTLARQGFELLPLYPRAERERNATWCPDGTSIIFTLTPRSTGVNSLYFLDLTTRRVQELPGSAGMDRGVCSVDGRFVLSVTDDYRKVGLYDTRSQKWTELLAGDMITELQWAPDARSFYYQDLLDENESIYRYWMKGNKRETLFDFHELFKQGYIRGRIYSLEPDGSFLFRMYRSDADLYALDVELP